MCCCQKSENWPHFFIPLHFSISKRFTAVHSPLPPKSSILPRSPTAPPPACRHLQTRQLFCLSRLIPPKISGARFIFHVLEASPFVSFFFFSLSLVFVNRSPAQCQRERINEMFWLQRRARSHTHTYTDTQGRGQTQAPLCRQPRRPPICPGTLKRYWLEGSIQSSDIMETSVEPFSNRHVKHWFQSFPSFPL